MSLPELPIETDSLPRVACDAVAERDTLSSTVRVAIDENALHLGGGFGGSPFVHSAPRVRLKKVA